jgi:hypothetical protein
MGANKSKIYIYALVNDLPNIKDLEYILKAGYAIKKELLNNIKVSADTTANEKIKQCDTYSKYCIKISTECNIANQDDMYNITKSCSVHLENISYIYSELVINKAIASSMRIDFDHINRTWSEKIINHMEEKN